MADIQMLLQNYVNQDDDQAAADDYNKYYESSMLDHTNPDDLLSPLEKLHKYCTSENIFTRQMVARSIVETVQSISSEQEGLSLLEIIAKLSDDIEPSIRCELMEQLSPCSMMLIDMKIIPDVTSTFILPIMVRYLTDSNNQVRKLSQNALLQLMDQDLIKIDDVETQICPVILVITEPESSDDFRTEAVTLMTKITCLLGAELTKKLFLDRFGRLCGDVLFHVRKACASNFGEVATVVGRVSTEKHLLRIFAHLCQDGVWGVRKACAETFMAVSGSCSKKVRYQILAPLFVGLLCDKSRWVQMAAYQALGQFISTFAEPEKSGFHVTEYGVLAPYDGGHLETVEYVEYDLSPLIEDPSLESDRQMGEMSGSSINVVENNFPEAPSPDEPYNTYNNFEFWRMPLPSIDLGTELVDPGSIKVIINSAENVDAQEDKCEVSDAGITKVDTISSIVSQEEDVIISNVSVEEALSESCNSDNIANTDLQNIKSDNNIEIEQDSSLQNSKKIVDKEQNIETHVDHFSNHNSADGTSPELNIKNPECVVKDILSHDGTLALDFYLQNSEDENSDDENSTLQNDSHYSAALISNQSLHNQKIVPPALLEHFISMTEPSKAQTIDGDLPRHCAFTLPGVVLALGQENWYLLRDTYLHLSTDMQWKVRRTLAFSIHDIALILGQKICVEDLVHVFNQFLKDLDEVRVGVLKHLFDFINILPNQQQKDYLPIFCEFQKTDNVRNWRFRKDLSEQLISLVDLYNEEELAEYLCPVALELASDKVADVRENAYNLICILLQKLYDYSDANLFHMFVTSIITLDTQHQHWVKRKACAQIYSRILEMTWYDKTHFARDFLPSLLHLCADVVPNIRLISSKTLLFVARSDYYQCLPEADEVRKHVDHTLETLQLDDDRDVRYFSGGKVEEIISRTRTESDADTTNLSEDGDRTYVDGGNVEEKFEDLTLGVAH